MSNKRWRTVFLIEMYSDEKPEAWWLRAHENSLEREAYVEGCQIKVRTEGPFDSREEVRPKGNERDRVVALIRAMSVEDRLDVNEFIMLNGRHWKSKMRALWDSGRDTGAFRRLRNTVGPSGLQYWGGS